MISRADPFVELLQCPACGGSIRGSSARLECEECGRRYGVLDGVPNLLLTPAEEDEPNDAVGRVLHSVVAQPRVYDFVQRLAGRDAVYRRLRATLAGLEKSSLLDVGAGTGSLTAVIPNSVRYIWLDNDPRKLSDFRAKSAASAILADASRLPLQDGSVDCAVSVGVAHHLDDEAFRQMLDELCRVVREQVVFLDPVASSTLRSRLLWRYDRGAHPRTPTALRRELSARFQVAVDEEFTVLHRYLLIAARPR